MDIGPLETLEIILLILAGLLILASFAGSVLPVLPGPPLAYAGMLTAHFFTYVHFSTLALVMYGIFTAVIVAVDYLIPAYGVKKAGGTKWGSNGSLIGMFLGIWFLPPWGMLLGAFAGAFVGELMAGQSTDAALKSGMATFLAFIAGTVIKLAFCFVVLVHFIIALF